jgi:outer membrane protein
MVTSLWVPVELHAAESDSSPLTLEQIIQIALEANLDIKAASKETDAAAFAKKSSRAEFYPTLNATYQYKYNEEEIKNFGPDKEEYSFVFSATQPLFSGFAITNQYKIAELGLDMAKANKKLVRQDVVLDATRAYFEILKAEKLLSVSKETVRQVSAQTDVVQNFYDVGMSPLNDLLESQVLLAEAKQQVVFAKNNLEIARSNMNRLLRRPTHQPIAVVDMLDVAPITYDLDTSIQMALDNRIEISMSDIEVALAEKDIELAKRTYYPTLNLQLNYYRFDEDWLVNFDEEGVDESNLSVADVRAIASWNIWDWGKTSNGTREKKSRLSQARINRENLKDVIRLSVTQAFLTMQTAEKNIATIETAIEQARENVRINEERFKEQVATSTDVLTAQTLLARTMNSYYSALYDFNIAKAALYREMGQEISE